MNERNPSSFVERARQRVREAVGGAVLARRSGALSTLSVAGTLRFGLGAARGGLGPHLASALYAHNAPARLALADETSRYSYAELEADSNRLAHGLAELGVSPGERVALMLPNVAEHVIAHNALPRLAAGAVEIGNRLKAREVAYILKNAQPQVILCHADYVDVMAEARRIAGSGAEVVVVGAGGAGPEGDGRPRRYRDLLTGRDTRLPRRPRRRSGGGRFIVYTSGTSGKPKGASRDLGDTGLAAVIDLMSQVGMRSSDRHLVVCPLYHSAAPAFTAMMMSLGAASVVRRGFDADDVLRTIAAEGITGAFMVPTMLARLAAVPRDERERHDLSSLRWVMSGAAPLPASTARDFQRAFGPLLWNFYGATETGLVSLAGPHDHTARPGTVGRLLSGNDIRILADDGRPAAPGRIGEIYARNAMLISGYHGDGEATCAAMRDGYFSVGDLGRMDDDGFLYIESRKSDMVISGGVNIYPREIEDHLVAHPDVVDAAVLGIPDDEWGERLVAFVVRRPGSSIDGDALVEFCREHLADYKKPRQVTFVDELPRTATGKVLKRELRSQ